MGCFRQIFLMVMVVVMSSQWCRVSLGIVIVADAEELDDWRLVMVENGERDRTLIGKVAGEDENEKRELRILGKFRAFFHLIKHSTSSLRNPAKSPAPAPAPAPFSGESPAYSPAPLRLIPPHFHRRFPQRTHPSRPHEIQRRNHEEGTGKKILVPVLVATASGIGFVACVVGLFCLGVKIRKRKKNSGTTSFKGKKGKSQNSSTRKVSVNPTLDFLYLNSVGVDLERQCSVSVKETREAEKGLNYNNGRLLEGEVRNRGAEILPESDNASSSSTKEIVSVHENDEQVVDSVGGFVVVPRESDSSDDESFHSFGASQSSRLSNASANSVAESSEHFPEREREILERSGKTSGIPPPPPPPPQFSNRGFYPLSSPETALVTLSSHKLRPNAPTLLQDLSKTASDSSSRPHLQTLSPDPSEKASSSSSSTNLQTHWPDFSEKAHESSLSTNVRAPPYPPPPPPPRHLPLAGSNKTPPPPPLSLDFSHRAPVGKDGAPLPKLKPLHWDKVRATPDRSMVWDKLRTSSFELDEEMIESLFGYKMQNSTKNDEGKSKTPSPGKHLLEPKRLQNITILLKALNATTEQICSALVTGEGLCLQQLEALVKMVPTKEEETKLCSYRGAMGELGSAERFIRAMLEVPFAFQRAEAMLYRETFEDEVVHLRNSFSMLEEACKELKSSRLFLKLLEAVLKTGNRMNVGTIRGGAKAFKLDALLKLSDVKGTDGKTTLLHFVVQEISRSEGIRVSDSIMGRIMNQRTNKNRSNEEKEEDYRRMGLDLVSGLNTELQNVKKTATIDLDVLTSSVSNLREGLLRLRTLAREKLSGDDESDRTFAGSMSLFSRHAEKYLEDLRGDEMRVMERVREVTEYFHGDVRGDDKNPLRIFVIVRDFVGMLDHVCRELRCVRVPSSPSSLAPFR